MSKLSFALSSLVAVIPAAFMMYLLIMGFIAGMPTMLMVFAGLAVICGVGVALLPILGFIVGPKTETAPAGAESVEPEEAIEDFGEEAEEADFEEMSSADEFETADGADDWGDFDDSAFEDDDDRTA